MNEFLSFISVIALWIGVSFFAWIVHRRRTGSRQQRRTSLVQQAADRVGEAQKVFDNVRRSAPTGGGQKQLVQHTHALLKRIQEHGAFFDGASALRQQVRQALKGEECEPLAEILHIRRDLWAASEIILIEDFRSLGPDFADEAAYERLREEAARVLFLDGGRGGEEDLIGLRLALARDEAAQLVADVDEAIRLAHEDERLPTFSEAIAYPIAAIRALPGQIRALRAQIAAFSAQVRAVAITIRQSETMTRGLSELRRAREELPKRVVTGLEKTSAAARQSAVSVKGHYDFLVQAYDVQAKYEELLRKAPEATERGKQFIARLELAEKSERLKLTVSDAAKRFAVQALAHLIAGLQRLQIALEKRLAAVQGDGGDPVDAKPPSQKEAAPAKAVKAAATPATLAKSLPERMKEDARPVASSMMGATQRITAAPPSLAKQVDTAPSVQNAPVRQVTPRGPVLGRSPLRAAQKQPTVPRLSLATAKQPEAPKGMAPVQSLAGDKPSGPAGPIPPVAQEPKPELAGASAPQAAPNKNRGWFSRRESGKPAASASKPAPETPQQRDASASNAAKAPGNPLVAAPKKTGWFGSRRQPEKDTQAAKQIAPTSLARAAARGGKSSSKTPVAAAAATAPVTPTVDSKPKQEKGRGWFGSRWKPDTETSSSNAPSGKVTLPNEKPSPTRPSVADAKAGASAKPIASPAEAKPAPKKRGWFGSRRSQVEASPGSKAASRVEQLTVTPPAKAAAAMVKPAETSAAEKPAPKKSRRWIRSRREADAVTIPVSKAGSGASVAESASKSATSPPAASSKTDIGHSSPVASGGAASAKAAKRGGWFGSRRSGTAKAEDKARTDQPAIVKLSIGVPSDNAAPARHVPDSPQVSSTLAADNGTAAPSPTHTEVATTTIAGQQIAEAAAPTSAMQQQAEADPQPKASLSAKLTGAGAIDAEADEFDNHDDTEAAAQETDDDDPGPLTRSILESRAASRQEEKPRKTHSRAFPWLRR
jgi:hypothetical protein